VNFRTIINRVSQPVSGKGTAVAASLLTGMLVIALAAPLFVSYWRTGEWGIARVLSPDLSGGAREPARDDYLAQFPGVTKPEAVAAAQASWKDDDTVIGVTAGGISRAYLRAALVRPARHVVNDVIAAVPVSVTYCNADDCVRAFTSEANGNIGPLNLSVGGLYQTEKLLLMVNGHRFHQRTLEPYLPDGSDERFPYKDLPFTVTTWKKWREAHPDTQASMSPQFDPVPPAGMRPAAARAAAAQNSSDDRYPAPR
jgi:hypothetical protein